MFEQQIEHTIALLRTQTIGDAFNISYKEIVFSSMPRSLKSFFDAEVQRWVAEERQRLLGSPHFLYGDSQVLSLFDSIVSNASDYAQFSREEFTTILDQSIKLVFNYVCRPQYTLTNYAYREASTLTPATLIEHVSRYTDYEYYRIILTEYFEKKHVADIGKERFENLLSLIDTEYVRTFDSFKLAHLTEPIFQLFNPGEPLESARVPIEAISVFFDDKNLTEIVDELDASKASLPTVSLHDLVMLLGNVDHAIGSDIRNIVTMHATGTVPPTPAGVPEYEVPEIDEIIEPQVEDHLPADDLMMVDSSVPADLEPPDEFIVDSLETEVQPGEMLTPDLDAISPAAQHDPQALEDAIPDDFFLNDEEPVPQQDLSFAADLEPPAIPVDHALPDISLDEESFLRALDLTETGVVENASPYAKDAEIPDIPLDHVPAAPEPATALNTVEPESPPVVSPPTMEQPQASPSTADPRAVIAQLGDLRASISASDKKKFVKKIFAKNDSSYESAIDVLNASSSWREASEHIDELFLQNKVDMYSRVAVEFTDSIYKRYLQRK
jgi:hypothetical protein